VQDATKLCRGFDIGSTDIRQSVVHMKGIYECRMNGTTDLGKLRCHKLRFLFCIGDISYTVMVKWKWPIISLVNARATSEFLRLRQNVTNHKYAWRLHLTVMIFQ
jgi:hypothetical protein